MLINAPCDFIRACVRVRRACNFSIPQSRPLSLSPRLDHFLLVLLTILQRGPKYVHYQVLQLQSNISPDILCTISICHVMFTASSPVPNHSHSPSSTTCSLPTKHASSAQLCLVAYQPTPACDMAPTHAPHWLRPRQPSIFHLSSTVLHPARFRRMR